MRRLQDIALRILGWTPVVFWLKRNVGGKDTMQNWENIGSGPYYGYLVPDSGYEGGAYVITYDRKSRMSISIIAQIEKI